MKTVEELKNLKNYGYSFFEQFTTTEIIAILIDKINEVIRGYDNFVQVPHIKGNWSQNENYLKFDLVNYNGETYICKRSCYAPTDIKDVYYFEKLSYDIELLKEALDHYKNVEEWDKIFTETSAKIEEKYTIRLNEINLLLEQKTGRIDVSKFILKDELTINNAFYRAIEKAKELGINALYIDGEFNVDCEGTNPPFYNNGGLKIPNNFELYMTPNTILNCVTSSKDGYCCINILNVNNVTINGGTIIGDRNTHIGTTGEYGFGVQIHNSNNINIKNLKCKSCWGDGIFIAYSKDVKIINCISDNNRRQGLSIVSGENIYIDNCGFINTNGTAPQAGIDIEPNKSSDIIKDIIIKNSNFDNNIGSGIEINIDKMIVGEQTLNLLDIVIENCKFNNNHTGITYSCGWVQNPNKINGHIQINNCLLNDRITIFNPLENIAPTIELNTINFYNWKGYAILVQCNNEKDGSSEENIIKYGGIVLKNINIYGKVNNQQNPNVAIYFEHGSNRDINATIENLYVENDITKWLFWDNGSGKVKLKNNPKYIGDWITTKYLNGVETSFTSDANYLLPKASRCKGKEFTIFHYGQTNTFRLVTTGSDKIIDNDIVSGEINVLSEPCNITLRSDGFDSWLIINKVGKIFPLNYLNNRKTLYGTNIPTNGSWKQGDRILNVIPSIGKPKSWVCTVTGNPGTWVSEGNL